MVKGEDVKLSVTQEKLGIKARGRKVVGNSDTDELREVQSSCDDVFDYEKGILRSKNTYS